MVSSINLPSMVLISKKSKFLCGHRKGHSPCLTLIGSVYTLRFIVSSAHTLLGPFILMLMLGSFVQQYSHNVIQSVNNCTAFYCCQCTHFAQPSLLYKLTLPIHTRGAHTVLGSVVLLYMYTLVQSLFTLWDCVHNCTVQLYTRQCQPGLCFVNQSQKSFNLPASL